MVMMVGEFDYEGIFTPADESYEDQIFYYRASNLLFAIFVLVMTILVMNLLVSHDVIVTDKSSDSDK